MNERSLTPTWAETFVDLHSASTADDLWSVLISWHGIRGSSQWDEPYRLFKQFHDDDPTDAEVTAALLCTDYRWRNASRLLVDRLSRSGLMSADQLDDLAEMFGAQAFEIVVESSDTPDSPVGSRRGRKTSVVQRPIWPPLRRWSARRQVERQPGRCFALIEAAETLPARDEAAVVAGVLDAAEHVPAEQRSILVSIGTNHGSGIVRLAALPVLSSTCGVDAALAVAGRDPSAHVRAWKPPVPVPSREDAKEPATNTDVPRAPTDRPTSPRLRSMVGQASLFDDGH